MTKKTKATQSKPRARIVNLTYEMVCKLLGVVVMSDDDDRTPHWVEKDAEGNVLRFYFTNQGANRLLQPSNVRRLRSDVVAGRWRNTYDAICILSTTDLVNGGHRLTALFLAWHFGEVPKEQTFECLLVERIEDASVVQFMDRGKARSDSDNLFMDPSWFPLPLAGFSKWKRPDRKIRDEVCKLVPPAVQSLIGLANGYGVHPSGKDQAGWDEVLETALKLSQEKFLRAYALMHDETGKRNTVGRYIPKRLVTVATVLDVPAQQNRAASPCSGGSCLRTLAGAVPCTRLARWGRRNHREASRCANQRGSKDRP
ncbi:MAG: hypothetical protein KatS3mg087_1351 [Patescibacteria group bacterium]|nr:MAG: hypothetical protein KatS3mg087_1351 [Patescibacteria group bacterium]